ncbi:MAG: DUF563 domain-containing protein [Paracoccaceae bacterium]
MTVSPPAFQLSPPNPRRGWSSALLDLEDPFVIPALESSFVQPAGVLHADGRYCPRGALWRKHRPLTVCPEPAKGRVKKLSGTWLWGGVLWNHFGHFLVESTSRLWAVPQLRDHIDGILFIPKRPRRGGRVLPYQQEFVQLLGCDARIKIINQPTQVDRLFVPGQGFGIGRISAGSLPFRQAMADHFASDVAPVGAEKVYVSRSNLRLSLGRILGERELERNLKAQGYSIFHPEDHDLATQIATYKAAKTILACEGSALHLIGMVAQSNQHIGIIARRNSGATSYITHHITSFSRRKPVVINQLVRSWVASSRRSKRSWLGEHDMVQLQAALEAHGFIEPSCENWRVLSKAKIQKALGDGYECIELRQTSETTTQIAA